MISEVYNERCEDALKRYPDGYFDIACVDPPYGINAPNMQMGAGAPSPAGRSSTAVKSRLQRLNGGGGKLKHRLLNIAKIEWDSETPGDDYWQELFRVSKHQIIWGGNYFPLPPTRCIICWDKIQPWENFSQWEMAWTSFDSPAIMIRYAATRVGVEEEKIHPTQKPVYLYKQVLHRLAFRDNKIINPKILDTHMGSQSSRIACHQLGLDYVGFEIDEGHFTAGNDRYLRATAQTTLFSY
jgi:site-specific DNA-methyltransferase (adenine-specific)